MSHPLWDNERISGEMETRWQEYGQFYEHEWVFGLLKKVRTDLQVRIDALETENAKLHYILQSFTPGGSEFVGNADRCAEWIKNHWANQRKLIMGGVKINKELREENAKLRALLPGPEVRAAIRDCIYVYRELADDDYAYAQKAPDFNKMEQWLDRVTVARRMDELEAAGELAERTEVGGE